ncbi:MAG: carbohydrate kinase [Clostridia bacterium]|nr:carbohydrate kinase [Clostridia bacterium]
MKIVTMGELLIDLTQTGECGGIPQYAANPGGAPANVAVAASLMGSETAFIGKVGNDSFGNMLVKTLKDKNVDISGIVKSDEFKTTLAVVSLDSRGERSFSFYRKNCADVNLTPDEIDIGLINSADILHFGSVSLTDEPSFSATQSVVKSAKAGGAIITYDPNYRPLLWNGETEAVAKMRCLLKFVDIIKVSEEELTLLTGEDDLSKGAEALLNEGVKIVLVTRGEKGAFYKTRSCYGEVGANEVSVADTNGAGDTFFGAFLSCLDSLENFEKNLNGCLLNAVKFACVAAEISVTRSGAIPAMPTKKEVEKAIKISL